MKGILCKLEVTKNILDGSQTQDRRPMNLPKTYAEADYGPCDDTLINWSQGKTPESWGSNEFAFIDMSYPTDTYPWYMKAPSQVGDILYVRERIDYRLEHRNYYYHADDKGVGHDIYGKLYAHFYKPNNEPKKVIPSIHMPEFAARIFLEVTEVRRERVQDISLEDIRAEGLVFTPECDGSIMRTEWKALWNTLYPGSWERNDWGWVRIFKKITKEQAESRDKK